MSLFLKLTINPPFFFCGCPTSICSTSGAFFPKGFGGPGLEDSYAMTCTEVDVESKDIDLKKTTVKARFCRAFWQTKNRDELQRRI